MKKLKDIVLIGGGGHCKSVIDVAESAGYHIIGILDIPENVGNKVLSYPILGSDEQIIEYVGKASFVITIGHIKSADLRVKLHEKVRVAGGEFATIISTDAHISKYTKIGEGTVILHKAVVNAGVQIGNGCIINTLANIEHDVVIGNYCHISTGAMINGDCNVGNNTFIGSGSVVVNNTTIGNNCVIGAGSLIQKSIQESGLYVGNPAVFKSKM